MRDVIGCEDVCDVQFASSKLRVDDWFKRVLTIVIEDLTTLMINCCYVLGEELIPTSLLDTLTTIADTRANKTTEQDHPIVQSKLTRLQHAAHKKRHKTDKNCVRSISSRPLDENETQVLSYGHIFSAGIRCLQFISSFFHRWFNSL